MKKSQPIWRKHGNTQQVGTGFTISWNRQYWHTRAEIGGNWLFQQLCLERMLPYLLSAGQFHYAGYISWHLLDMTHLLPPKAKADLLAGAHVCRHCEGCWNSISDDQFGQQTAIKTGKGVLKGITLSPELVTERIDSFLISVYVSDAMGHMYSRLINYPTLRHRPSTKRKVMSDGSLNLTTGRHFRQNLQNIPTHWQSKAKSSTQLSMVRSFLRMSICGWCSRHCTDYGRFISQHLAEWLSR